MVQVRRIPTVTFRSVKALSGGKLGMSLRLALTTIAFVLVAAATQLSPCQRCVQRNTPRAGAVAARRSSVCLASA
jgi:hypothetical protein